MKRIQKKTAVTRNNKPSKLALDKAINPPKVYYQSTCLARPQTSKQQNLNKEGRHIMYYKAKLSISPDGETVLGYIPAFLHKEHDQYDFPDMVRFISIMEAEINKGEAFDMAFFRECKSILAEWVTEKYGRPPDEAEIAKSMLSKMDVLENQNIINIHKHESNATNYFCMAGGGIYAS